MSVSSFGEPGLSDATHGAGIADELESFFNVLLHLAVRFCPHNVSAPRFVHNHFVYPMAYYNGEMYCPRERWWTIAGSGYPSLEFMSSELVFGRPEQPNKPLNGLLRTMLACLHARYKIFEYEHKMAYLPDPSALRQRVDLDTLPPDDALIFAELRELFDRDAKPKRPSDAICRLARLLKDHHTFRELFREMVGKVWPQDEVMEDRLSFRAVLREQQEAWRTGLLRGYRSPSESIPRDFVVEARRALSQRRILG